MKLLNFLFLPIVTLLFFSCGTTAQTYSLPELEYEFDALEPHIDAKTMEIHYSKHHQGYVDKLNAALEKSDQKDRSIEDILMNVGDSNPALRNNGGGHYNHQLYWDILSPNPTKGPEGALKEAIDQHFGGLDKLKEEMNNSGADRFGSGWTWLIVTSDKKLKVTSTPNQDNPLMDVAESRGIPILGIDVWEHAYYLKYQNKRGDYLSKIWNVIDWAAVSERYNQAVNSPNLSKLK